VKWFYLLTIKQDYRYLKEVHVAQIVNGGIKKNKFVLVIIIMIGLVPYAADEYCTNWWEPLNK
jgi:hypothetical protein